MAVEMSVDEARNRLNELLERAAAGEDVVITRVGAPAVSLEKVPRGAFTADAGALWGGTEGSFDMGTDYGPYLFA